MAGKKNKVKNGIKKTSNSAANLSIPKLHSRNLHQGRYDMPALCRRSPLLKPFIETSIVGEETINFNSPEAVLALNQALLAYFYNVDLWQIPEGYLCPPIPGRADYIHYLADLLSHDNKGEIPRGKQVRVLDVGCGANCIYPIIGSQSYGWQFVGSDIDLVSVSCAKNIVQSNSVLKNHIKLVHQRNEGKIFEGVIKPDESYDLTMCNPPFYESMQQAQANSKRKQSNLLKNKAKRGGQIDCENFDQETKRNFGGQNAELWCQGGELRFVSLMVKESVMFKDQVTWFSSLISNKENVQKIQKQLTQIGAQKVVVIDMAQGNKISRFIAWGF